MSQDHRTIFLTCEQGRVRKAMGHRPVFKLDDEMPADLAAMLLKLDEAFQSQRAEPVRD